MSKKLEVTIKRSGKLTLTEINALTKRIFDDAQAIVSVWNANYQDTFDFQRKVKALKTKHGILAAERAIVFLATKHKKVDIVATSNEYRLALELLHKDFKKRGIMSYKGYQSFEEIKNKLILAQVESTVDIFEFAKVLSNSLVK